MNVARLTQLSASAIAPWILAALAAMSVLPGCGSKRAQGDSASPDPALILPSTPIVLFAEEGLRPGEISISLINQTDRTIRVLPQYFALILGPEREDLRPFDPGRDRALFVESRLEPAGQLPLTLYFAGQGRPGGRRLVFNPQPEGLPPTMVVIKARGGGEGRTAQSVLP